MKKIFHNKIIFITIIWIILNYLYYFFCEDKYYFIIINGCISLVITKLFSFIIRLFYGK